MENVIECQLFGVPKENTVKYVLGKGFWWLEFSPKSMEPFSLAPSNDRSTRSFIFQQPLKTGCWLKGRPFGGRLKPLLFLSLPGEMIHFDFRNFFLGWKHQRSRRSDFLGSKNPKSFFFLGGMVTSSYPLIYICEGRSTSIVFLYHFHHVFRYISVKNWFIRYTFVSLERFFCWGGVYANTLQGHFA